MELTPHEKNLIEAIRNEAKNNSSDFTITLSFAGPGVRVRWESQGVQGNGAGASLDEAYQQAWQNHVQKVIRIVLAEKSQSESDPGSAELQ
jgi:hypothetical protein